MCATRATLTSAYLWLKYLLGGMVWFTIPFALATA